VRFKNDKQKAVATTELLKRLAIDQLNGGCGLRTKELRGTPLFHGERTLSSRQIIELLDASDEAAKTLEGAGARTFYLWRLKTPDKALEYAHKPVPTWVEAHIPLIHEVGQFVQ